jgi:hypothetical protein
MSTPRRIALALLMGTSLVTMAASILKVTSLQTVSSDTKEPQYTASLGALWANVEQTLVIMMASVPALRSMSMINFPAFSRLRSSIVTRFAYNSKKSSATSSSPSQSGHYYDLEMNEAGVGVGTNTTITYYREGSGQDLVTEYSDTGGRRID